LTCTENFVKFGHVVVEKCDRTNKHTNKQTDISRDTRIAILRTPPWGTIIKHVNLLSYSKVTKKFSKGV